MTIQTDARSWADELAALSLRIGPRFRRREPRARALAYLRGLLSPIERKTGWQLAEAAGDRTPDGVQDFLARMRWDADAVRDDLRAYVVEPLGEEAAGLALDETGFLKKGAKSAGVHRQYAGTAGRIENCRIGVFLAYASGHGQALIDRALYLPQSWTNDREGCRQAGKGYGLQVTSNQHLGLARVDEWLNEVPDDGWVRLSAGDGAKGLRLYDWAYLPHRGASDGWHMALLIRARIDRPDELAFFLTLAPAATPLAKLVEIAGKRWTIEACFEAAKGEVGLDQYEVRSWTGWRRHITLAMLAHAYLAVVRKHAIGGRGKRRSRRRVAAAHRARSATTALGAYLGQSARPICDPLLVRLAKGAPATRQTMPLEAPSKPP